MFKDIVWRGSPKGESVAVALSRRDRIGGRNGRSDGTTCSIVYMTRTGRERSCDFRVKKTRS